MIDRLPFFIILFITFFLFSSFNKNGTELKPQNDFVVVLDAGHGGHDPGNLGNGYLEKNIALNIVLQIGSELEKNGVKVIYTRKDDTFVDLFKRGEIANKANADLFVSVHCDSHNSDAYGAGTFVLGLHANKQNFEVAKKENSVIYLEDNYEERYADYDINSPESIIGLTVMQEEFLDQSIQLAKFMQDNFTESLSRKDRKVKQAGFIVLHQTFMPSVLVETGFLTNKDEGAFLNSQKGQQEMGKAIAKAILKYRDGVDSSSITNESAVLEQTSIKKEEMVSEKKEDLPEEKTPTEVVKNKEVEKKKDIVEPPVTVVETKTENIQERTAAVKTNDEIVFKIQLMASSKVVPLTGENFNGLNTLTKEQYKNMYRYMYGNTNSYLKAKLLKENAQLKGYTSSYVVAYKDGQRIALSEALKYVGEQ